MRVDAKPQPGVEPGAERERAAVERAQAGALEALEPILADHAEALFSQVLLPRVGDRALAEDLVRDTLVTAIERIGAFRWQERSLFFWLRRIALNRAIDHFRARGRAERLVAALQAELDEASPAADDALIAEEDRRRARARIDAALARLPERYALAIRLRLVEERPREEAARALGVTVGNLDVILHRAVRAFRREYGDDE